MGMDVELVIETTLRDALELVMGTMASIPSAVEVLAAHIFSLVKDLGLSESQHVDPHDHERPELPTPLNLVVGHYLPLQDDDALRDRLYNVFVSLAANARIGRMINRNAPLPERAVLLIAQTAWNLERNDRRPKLPLGRGQVVRGGLLESGDIVDPVTRKDFARMTWTQRSNLKNVPGRSSGDSFRKQTARLAVLAAEYLVNEVPLAPNLGDALLELTPDGRRSIVWRDPHIESTAARLFHGRQDHDSTPAASDLITAASGTTPVLIGSPAEVGIGYEWRGFDDEIERVWADGGNRRVWLRGGPGHGKSFAARRIVQDSLTERGDMSDRLLIWVDSADAASVTRALALAAERVIGSDVSVAADAPNREDRLARSMLEWLRTTEVRWLVVFDDARADELIRQQLLPPGTNASGRALITTLGSTDGDAAGRQILAALFSPSEAERFLRTRLKDRPADERAVLAEKVGHHPLALAMATATIIAERMPIADWIAEFDTLRLDEAADRPDTGGYARSLSATWRVALVKAAMGMPEGVVERAAMVAALQSPDGHPTWLWRRDAVIDWVDSGSGSARRSRRMHPALLRLVEFGVLELHGDWSDGRIAIHQMAARAVREAADPALLSEVARILAKEWILQLTSHPDKARPEDVEAAVRGLRVVPGVDSFTTDALHALSEFAEPTLSPTLLHWSRDELEALEPLLLRGGAIGRADLAERRAYLAQAERAHGLHAEARANFTTAIGIYAALITDPSLDDESHAEFLESLADVEGQVDSSDSAREHRQQAIELRERVETVTPDTDRSLSNLIALTDLHHGMANGQRSLDTLDRALALNAERPTSDTDDAAAEHRQLARRLASHGRVEEAIEHMRRAADLSTETRFGHVVRLKSIGRELAGLYGRIGEWKKAERWMKRSKPDPLLLASIQLHRGRAEAARENLARAAREWSPPSTAESNPEPLPDAIREAREDFLAIDLSFLLQKAVRRKRWGDAADLAAISLELVRDSADASPGENPERLAREYLSAGVVARQAGRHEVAVEWLTSGVRICEMLAQLHPDDESRRKLAESLVWLAAAHTSAGASDEGVAAARRAVGILDDLDANESPMELGLALSTLADALEEAGDTDGAIAAYTRQVRHLESKARHGSREREAIEALADALGTLTRTCFIAGRWSDALQPATQLLDARQSLADAGTESIESQAELAEALTILGQIHGNLGRLAESEALAREAVSVRQILVGHDPSVTEWQVKLAYGLVLHADSLSKLDRDGESVEALIEAVNHLQLPAELSPEEYGAIQVDLLRQLATALRAEGRSSEAEDTSTRADLLERGLHNPEGD